MATLRDLPQIAATIKEEGKRKFVVVPYAEYKRFMSLVEVKGTIDEDEYIAKYPEVGVAVAAGRVKSATVHYVRFGYVEQRTAKILVPPPPGTAE